MLQSLKLLWVIKDVLILVDWTALPNSQHTTENGEHCVLRASLISEGRSTLYEEAHSKRKEGNDTIHQEFLNKLKSVLPRVCRPYIVTYAGFKNDLCWLIILLFYDLERKIATH